MVKEEKIKAQHSTGCDNSPKGFQQKQSELFYIRGQERSFRL